MNHYLFWFIFIDMININTYLNENPTQTLYLKLNGNSKTISISFVRNIFEL